ncbi:MAG: hypothetical protein GY839_01535 [candidate division Zixibacteria bacterium]|nr:hypothetical protein [candidate division Zixibacteria bacterium]
MRNIYLLIILSVVILLGCTSDKQVDPVHEDNVLITLNFPDDPLLESVISLKVTVSSLDISEPFSDSLAINAIPDSLAIISTYAPAGEDRLFTMHLYQADGTIAFWTNYTEDVPEEGNLEFAVSVVQAAAGSASRIKIFRDNLPWDSEALDNMLAELGITFGAEDNQYVALSSSTLDTVTLIGGEDLMIIANDQAQEFYNNYAIYQTKINAFVYNGGTLFWEACDLGWAQGSIEQAGIDLPENIEITAGYESYNYLTSSLWQLTAGLDSVLFGTYASHEGFRNLPSGAVIYTIDSRGLPTLVSYSYGTGWVIVSGQPLEYAYDRGDSLNTGSLLPRIIRFVLGLDLQEPASARLPQSKTHFNDNNSLGKGYRFSSAVFEK